MEILTAASLPGIHIFSEFNKKSRKNVLNCSRFGRHDDVEVHQFKSVNDKNDPKHSELWKLFKEAQKVNILYLNKHRVRAVEDLDRVKNERDLLLDRVKQLELENMSRDKRSVITELLLRIDSLVLNAVVGSAEASDLRRLVMDSRSFPDDYYE